jgi:MFS family permease
MIFLAMLVAILLYLDRVCISTAAKSLSIDLNVSPAQIDFVLSAFFWTYALGQIPAGWLGDRFGARWMLTAYVVLWSLSTGLLGLATGWVSLLILRLLCGLFEAGAYPVAAGIVRKWVPMESRGTASSIVAIGGRLGGAAAPILTVQIMLWCSANRELEHWTWRPAMILYGLLGIVFAAAFLKYYRNSPAEHPGVNQLERDRIANSPEAVQDSHKPDPRLAKSILLSFPLWMNCLVQFASNLGWAFLVTKVTLYLDEVHKVDFKNTGYQQSLTLVAGIAGLMLGGILTDRFTRRFGLRWGRSLTMGMSRLAVAVAFILCAWTSNGWVALACLIGIGFATDLGTAACWAWAQDVGGRRVGTILGWSNMWGNFGAAASPIILGWLVKGGATPIQGWSTAFYFCAAINLLATVAAMGISARRALAE